MPCLHLLSKILVPDITTLYQDLLYGVCPKKASLAPRKSLR
ncbi:hypothetical protein MITSMUL_05392 [Mitsuokella multacida DSM 20544]|uniref:Uncharacterized protein n=1 Tax=Mitsuokella multacida DSM 20544 TaxID=500635 RepID=C9KQ76_9FIRM|nr:hypothetical protein MITSMUL_05392 [Mitsuokella multacida DSM 20544]